jgi:hypothetical protein
LSHTMGNHGFFGLLQGIAVWWGIAAVILIVLVQKQYIVRRYTEAHLTGLRYFTNPVLKMFDTFWLRHAIPGFYTGHLFLVWALPDWIRLKLRGMSDLKDRQLVLRHFSRAEVVLSVLIGLGLMVLFAVAVMTVIHDVVFGR